jgi:hypothetical protein
VDEPLGGRQSDTAAAAGDHGDLAMQSCHQCILISSSSWESLSVRLFRTIVADSVRSVP